MKTLKHYITEYLIKKKLNKPIISNNLYEELCKVIQPKSEYMEKSIKEWINDNSVNEVKYYSSTYKNFVEYLKSLGCYEDIMYKFCSKEKAENLMDYERYGQLRINGNAHIKFAKTYIYISDENPRLSIYIVKYK